MDQLKEIFYDPKNAYPNINQLSKLAKKKGVIFNTNELKEFYNGQQINQLFKPRRKEDYDKIRSLYDQTGTFQADLMDVSRWQNKNKNVSFLLNIIDVFSRYAWSIPLTSKKSIEGEIAEKLEGVYKQFRKLYPNNPIVLETDNGNEFLGDVSKINKKYQVQEYKNDPKRITAHTTMGLIERFNRTLLMKLKKHIYTHSLHYLDSLDDFVNFYNKTVHPAIHDTPKNIFMKKRRPIRYIPVPDEVSTVKLKKYDIVVGDLVRLRKDPQVFDKKTLTPTQSNKIYQVVDIINGKKYVIQNLEKEKPKNKFYIKRELEKLPDSTALESYENMKEKINEIEKNESINRNKRRNARQGLDVDKSTGKITVPKRMEKKADTRLRQRKN
jgi:hypothetical protein